MTQLRNFGYLMFLVFALSVGASATSIDAALSIEDGRVSSFYLAIGDHYQMPEKEIILVKKQGIPDDEMAVVFYLARQARVTPEVVIRLRLGGMTWMEVTSHFGLTAEIFYVAIEKPSGPPYGKAWGHFKNRHRNEWGSITLSDIEIANFVNLRFVSERYGLSPNEVVKMREQGQSFTAINDKVKNGKGSDKAKRNDKAESADEVSGAKPGKKGKGK